MDQRSLGKKQNGQEFLRKEKSTVSTGELLEVFLLHYKEGKKSNLKALYL